jgi:hypothetical protein
MFVNLIDQSFQRAPLEMWGEVFTDWAALHGRVDEESTDQLGQYEDFLRASLGHLKQFKDTDSGGSSSTQEQNRTERILSGIFDYVARSIAFAERKIAGGKMPRRNESAVLGRDDLVHLLGDDTASLEAAIQRFQRQLHSSSPPK